MESSLPWWDFWQVPSVLPLRSKEPGGVPAIERAALIAFYNQTGGPNWTDNQGWDDGGLRPVSGSA